MFKITQTYKNYNGQEKTETLYFNLNKVEVLEMEGAAEGSYAEMLKNVVASRNSKDIMDLFRTLLLKSYGVKTEDGEGFIKSEELTKKFEQSAVYPEVFMTLCTDAKKASDFIAYVMPLDDTQRADIKKIAAEEAAKKMKEVSNEIIETEAVVDGNVTNIVQSLPHTT